MPHLSFRPCFRGLAAPDRFTWPAGAPTALLPCRCGSLPGAGRTASGRGWACKVLVGLLLVGGGEVAKGVVLFPRDGGPPVMGYLVREDERQVVVREELPDGSSRETRLGRAQIEERIDTVAPSRLERLSPDRPHEYLEYAEELAERRRDPEARDAALRLYLIAIARGDERVRSTAWRGLIVLARTPAQRRMFLAAAAWHGVVLPAAESAGPVTDDPETSAARSALLEALVRLRQGRGSTARTLLERPGVREQAARLAAWIAWEELVAACGQGEPAPELLSRLLKGELLLREHVAGERAAASGPRWSQARAGEGLAPLPSLELDALTPYDPAECLYRDGRWQRP